MSIGSVISRIFFPLKCPLCGELVPLTDKVCNCCKGDIKNISQSFCIHCGSDYGKCTCDINKEKLQSVAGVCYYSGKAKWQIGLFKFEGKKKLAEPLSLQMSERAAKVYSDISFDLVTFVPISKKSFEVRGYNQSELLAKGVSKRLFIPLQKTIVKQIDTRPQHTLNAQERLSNLDNAFAFCEGASVKGKNVLLCDDIKTTGTTLKRCADVLYENGAKNVCCLVYAVTEFMTDI